MISKAKNQRKIYIGSVIVVLSFLALGGWILYDNNLRAVVKVGSYSLNKTEYQAIISDAKSQDITEEQAKKGIVSHFSVLSAADSVKMKYKDDLKTVPSDENRYTTMAKQTKVVNNLAAMYQTGAKQVAVVYFPFSRYAVGFLPTNQAKSIGNDADKIGNIKAIRDDMKYAKKLANKYRKAYIDKEMTASEIVDEVLSTDRLNFGQAYNTSFYGHLGNDGVVYNPDNMHEITLRSDVFELFSKVHAGGGISDVLELKATDLPVKHIPELNRKGRLAVAWYFVVNEGNTMQNLDKSKKFVDKKENYEKNTLFYL